MKNAFLLFLILLIYTSSMAAQQTINNGETMGQARAKINENFTELYGLGGMTYPSGTGIPYVTTGTSWGTTLTLDTDLTSVSTSDDSVPSAKATKTALDLKLDAASLQSAIESLSTLDLSSVALTLDDDVALDTDITYETLDTNGDVGTGAGQLAIGNHTHSGVYQAYDADLTTWAGITPGSNVGAFLGTPTIANFWTAVTGEGAFAATLLSYADAAAVRAGLDLEPGTDIQPFVATMIVSDDCSGETPTSGVICFEY